MRLQSNIVLVPSIASWQKSFVKELRARLAGIVEDLTEAEKEDDDFEISYQLYSFFTPFDEKFKSFHEGGLGFDEISKNDFPLAVQKSIAYSQFLSGMLMKTAEILDSALRSKDYSHVLGQFDEVMGLMH